MRYAGAVRLPWSNLYRAFPELDAFSAEECERFIRQVRVQHRRLVWFWTSSLVLLTVWLVVFLPWLAFVVAHLRVYLGAPAVLLAIVLPIIIFIPALYLRDRLLIRAIRDRLDLARCTQCRHSVLGLPLLVEHAEETVRCPECGSAMVLRELGLKHADLIPPEQTATHASLPGPPAAHPAPPA